MFSCVLTQTRRTFETCSPRGVTGGSIKTSGKSEARDGSEGAIRCGVGSSRRGDRGSCGGRAGRWRLCGGRSSMGPARQLGGSWGCRVRGGDASGSASQELVLSLVV